MLNQNNKISNRIFKQEFITWEYVDHGIKTTWIRKFKEHHDYDHYSSEIFLMKNHGTKSLNIMKWIYVK